MKKIAYVNVGIQLGTYYFSHEIDIEQFEKVTGENYENCNPITLKDYCTKTIDRENVQLTFNDDCAIGSLEVDTDKDSITEVEHDYYDEIKQKEMA
jgi:hypothetical protein